MALAILMVVLLGILFVIGALAPRLRGRDLSERFRDDHRKQHHVPRQQHDRDQGEPQRNGRGSDHPLPGLAGLGTVRDPRDCRAPRRRRRGSSDPALPRRAGRGGPSATRLDRDRVGRHARGLCPGLLRARPRGRPASRDPRALCGDARAPAADGRRHRDEHPRGDSSLPSRPPRRPNGAGEDSHAALRGGPGTRPTRWDRRRALGRRNRYGRLSTTSPDWTIRE